MYNIIENADYLQNGYIIRDGFVFTSLAEPKNIFDAIVVRNPLNANSYPQLGVSSHTLEKHIQFINEKHLEKAVIFAENIQFILKCPTLKHISIIPADTAADNFDFSPLYQMPEIATLLCRTNYGYAEEYVSTVDYSRIKGIRTLTVSGTGHTNYRQIETLKELNISGFKGEKRDLTDLFDSKILENLTIIQCGTKSLKGLEQSGTLSTVSLWYNRSLSDVSALKNISKTLKVLSIEACGKITDFSFLDELTDLEHLELLGKNELPDLNFLKRMKNSKLFHLV